MITTERVMAEIENVDKFKRKKTRRGKKRIGKKFNQNFDSSTLLTEDNHLHTSDEIDKCPNCLVVADECERLRKVKTKSSRRKSRQKLRPRYSPKAPRNSTQFLMDDHFLNSINFVNFESPEMIYEDRYYENMSPDEMDIDRSSQSLMKLSSRCSSDVETCDNDEEFYKDTYTFMEKDFENTYENARYEEFEKLSKKELVDKILEMEREASKLMKRLDLHRDSRKDKLLHQDLNLEIGSDISTDAKFSISSS